MTAHANAAAYDHSTTRWTSLFADESDQDLEFDEGLEDDDLHQHKPPTRRPLVWILLLLIAVGVVYWTMKPDLAKIPELSSPISAIDDLTPLPGESESTPSDTEVGSASSPRFGEGDTVMLSTDASVNSKVMNLTFDSAGARPGTMILTGETLIILDGETIDEQWVYQVSTASGKKRMDFRKTSSEETLGHHR